MKNIPHYPGKIPISQMQSDLPIGGNLSPRNVLHSNPDPEHIPCHRVVNAQGQLSRSYAFGGIDAQRRLLESEGVVFKNDQVVELSASQMILE